MFGAFLYSQTMNIRNIINRHRATESLFIHILYTTLFDSSKTRRLIEFEIC